MAILIYDLFNLCCFYSFDEIDAADLDDVLTSWWSSRVRHSQASRLDAHIQRENTDHVQGTDTFIVEDYYSVWSFVLILTANKPTYLPTTNFATSTPCATTTTDTTGDTSTTINTGNEDMDSRLAPKT